MVKFVVILALAGMTVGCGDLSVTAPSKTVTASGNTLHIDQSTVAILDGAK